MSSVAENITICNAAKEVLEILKNTELEFTSRISSEEMIILRQLAKRANIEVEINPEIRIEEQKCSKEAKEILALLYYKFVANEKEKKELKEKWEKNDKKISNSGFNSLEEAIEYNNRLKENEKLKMKSKENVQKEDKALMKSESIWKKIINRVQKFFHSDV